MKRLPAILLLTAVFLTACHHDKEMDPAFVEGDGITLQVGGKTVLQYDPLTWQLGYSAARREFRAFTDDLSAYYVLTCRTMPAGIGESVTADLEWAAEGGGIRRKSGVKFTVKKRSDDGRIWLWSASEGIGIVIRILQK